MNFQTIKPVEDYQFYLDLAFRRAKEAGDKMRGKKLTGGRLEKSRTIELAKMHVIVDTLTSRMEAIIKNYPSLNALSEYYQELIKLSTDYVQLRKSLAAIQWLSTQTRKIFLLYKSKLIKNKQFERVNPIKREFLGRVSSLIKQVKKDFVFLEQARRIMKKLPDVKEECESVAIVGFPNVGKTTLLHKLTGSKADINSYPFTTLGVNVSYYEDIQLLDTPGTLNRFSKMNDIEKIAYVTVKHCASRIIYVFDLTESYPLDRQLQLYQKLKKDYALPIIIYCSKADILEEDILAEFAKKHKAITDVDDLKKKLEK